MKIRKNLGRIVITGVIALLWSTSLFADAPYEKYHVEYKDISKEVLKSTIAILTIDSGVKRGTELKSYSKSGDEFTFDRILKVDSTMPVSNHGYHPGIPESHIANYRYPIVSKSDRYVCIVYDPKKNLRTWINLDEAEKDFYTEISMLDSVSVSDHLVVDIFSLTEDGRRTIYKEPKQGAASAVISKAFFEGWDLRIVGEKNDFIQVEGPVWIARGFGSGTFQLKTWIKKRDKEGNLTIWLIQLTRD